MLRLVGLKECGLGAQSLGLGWPLSEVGNRVIAEEDMFHPSSPHNSGMSYCSGDQAQKERRKEINDDRNLVAKPFLIFDDG